jgi:hypothetical protein
MLVFNKYFYKKKKSKLYFEDRVAVLNDFIYQTGGSKYTSLQSNGVLYGMWIRVGNFQPIKYYLKILVILPSNLLIINLKMLQYFLNKKLN